jgi:hypothetical protein
MSVYSKLMFTLWCNFAIMCIQFSSGFVPICSFPEGNMKEGSGIAGQTSYLGEGGILSICETVFNIINMKNAVFWDAVPCRSSGLNRKQEPAWAGGCRLATSCKLPAIYELEGRESSLLVLCARIFLPWRWRRYVPPKRRFSPLDLHGATSQKMAFFIVTAVKTSNLTQYYKQFSFFTFTCRKWCGLTVWTQYKRKWHS